jgi:hypothetical protein
MKRRYEGIVLIALLPALPLCAQEGEKQSFAVVSTTRSEFPPGGTIRIDNSYGYLTVEGWDEPRVEVTLAKSTDRFYKPQQEHRATRHLDEVVVASERRSDQEFAITTSLPVRNSLFTSVLPSGRIIGALPLLPKTKRGITAEYRVHVPRDSRLIVHHDNGYVWISDITGNIEVHSHTGDMIVLLADPRPSDIDAITRMGSVTSDFAGRHPTKFLVGTHFIHSSEDPARKVLLRMGRGCITIKKDPPSGPFGK